MTDRTFSSNQRWWLVGLAAAAAILLAVVGVIVLADDDDAEDVAAESTTTSSTDTTSTTTTSTTAPTTETTAFAPVVDPFGVAFPGPDTSQRFESPEPAARAYASDVLGFTELVVGPFQEGDSRSGEIAVTDREDGLETIILVRQMEDDTWFVLGSQAPDISVDTPTAGDEIGSPFETTGTALAFEGTVDVFVRTQDDPATLGEGFVTGSGVPPAGPFDGSIEFEQPDEEKAGIVVYRTLSAEDGHVLQATSFPVRLLPA